MAANLLGAPPPGLTDELFETLLSCAGTRIERIVSTGQTTPERSPYRQDHDEWVAVLAGAARLWIDGDRERDLRPGDHVLIPAGSRHRVTWTDPDAATVWLAVHLPPAILPEPRRPSEEGRTTAKPGTRGAPPVFDASFRARLAGLFRWRRDVRRFRRDPVPAALLDELLRLAWLAPSVGLSEPWRVVTVDDPARRAAVRANFEACNARALSGQTAGRAGAYARLKLAGLDEAPHQLAMFAEPEPTQGHGLGRATMPDSTLHSAVMAAHTLWLAARAAGVGLGWVSILDPALLADALEVPGHWVLIGYFCLGYPSGDDDTPELERQGWERRHPDGPVPIRR